MLWWANLYINEGANDWNNQNPWTDNNEWNRTHDGTTYFQGLSNLNAGNGKQTVTITPYTPLITISGSPTAPSINNFNETSVAYSYPLHNFKPIQNGVQNKDSGNMNSPFDFNKKIMYQRELLTDNYNSNGNKYVQLKSIWPNPQAGDSLNRFNNFQEFYLFV